VGGDEDAKAGRAVFKKRGKGVGRTGIRKKGEKSTEQRVL